MGANTSPAGAAWMSRPSGSTCTVPACSDVAGLCQHHLHLRGALHLPDQLVVLPALDALAQHDRARERRWQAAEQLAHRIRTADRRR